jgi:hypothetical protein
MLLSSRDRLKPFSDDELVFKSPESLQIDDRNFCRRAWKTVLVEVGVKYRKPYTTRKTATGSTSKTQQSKPGYQSIVQTIKRTLTPGVSISQARVFLSSRKFIGTGFIGI